MRNKVLLELNAIYNNNCMDVLKEIPDKSIDLVLTDPPYGIGLKYDSYEDTDENWTSLISAVLPELMRVGKMVIMPCCRIAKLPWIYTNFPPDWIMCWYKGSTGHRSYIGFNDWEPHLVYGKNKKSLYMHDYFQTKASPKKGTFDHPCPKPNEWAEWIIQRATVEGDTILDPFMGSGTVAYVARSMNRNFIGSELSSNYCNVINKRLNGEDGDKNYIRHL